ncbi:hypothetical protein PtA15_7A177 [Puccinia triticina]|uniref:GYF domain-containing protein n=1 Tax=Puccinia triticina TaxID=208348 RepID=A0ABY7CMJ7_9BASI|nr:uncharacterized protein PtA15_7A177 [Puccinia triticina]WAQ86451.1 hypothetical protein PtA15_7A177 [Puccinia triticina]
MANKRALDPPLEQSPTSLNQAKKVKFGALPTLSSSKTEGNKPPSGSSSTFEPGDDATDLQFDELNQVGKIKKGKVKVDGYDSDSSTENTEVRNNKKNKSADEDDIFADEKEQTDANLLKNHPKFEKIDVGLKEDGDLGDDYSEEEEDFVPGDEFANADDAPRARRKSKKGMGFLLSKFNMAEELQEGRMAADGSYVASAKDPEAVHDNWLEGVNSKKAIKQAREAKRLRDEQLRTQAEKEESMTSLRTRKDCYIALLGLLPAGDGRSVSQILCQLGNDKRALQQNKPKRKVGKKSAIDKLVPESMDIDHDDSAKGHRGRSTHAEQEETGNMTTAMTTSQTRSDEEVKLDRRIGEITDLASMLMGTHGELDIYDMSHGSITGILKSEGLVPRDWVPLSTQDSSPANVLQPDTAPPQPVRKSLISRPTLASSTPAPQQQQQQSPQIYYKFIKPDPASISAGSGAPVYGPFDKQTMLAWAQQGFFGQDFQLILVRLHSATGSDNNSSWGSWNQIVNF